MQIIKCLILTVIILSSPKLFAQYPGMFGAGIYPGASMCPYGIEESDSLIDISDDIADVSAEIVDKRKDLRDAEREVRDFTKDSERADEALRKSLIDTAANAAIEHMSNPSLGPSSYSPFCGEVTEVIPNGTKEQQSDPSLQAKPEYCSTDPDGPFCSSSFTVGVKESEKRSSKLCQNLGKNGEQVQITYVEDIVDYSGGARPTRVTKTVKAAKKDLFRSLARENGEVDPAICRSFPKDTKVNQSTCTSALTNYVKAKKGLLKWQAEKEKLAAELEALKEKRVDLKAQLKSEKRELDREARRQAREERTEGGCTSVACMSHQYGYRKPSALETAVGVGLNVLGGVISYRGAQMSTRAGWPAQPYAAAGAIYPFIANGIYGALGGGMSGGAFGCAGGIGGGGFGMGPYGMMGPGGLMGAGAYANVGGAFGYPVNWPGLNLMGPYNPGLAPWGIPGPWGGGGLYGAFPGGFNVGAGAGINFGGGFPMGGFGGFPMGGFGGFPGAGIGIGAGFGGGFPMGGFGGFPMGGFGGFPGAGIGIGAGFGGGFPGFGGGFPMGGGFPFPGAGIGIGGGFGGGFPGGFPMMAGGLPMYGAPGMGGFPGMGVPGMFPGMGGMGGMGGGGLGIQYQQQMMQQYMAQLNMYMETQQRAQFDYQQRMQVVGTLQQQMMEIQMQIQLISQGSSFGGVGLGIGVGGGIGGGIGGLPYPSRGGIGTGRRFPR